MSTDADLISNEYKTALARAAAELASWTFSGPEPKVYVGKNTSSPVEISSLCRFILTLKDEPRSDRLDHLLGFLLQMRETPSVLKENLAAKRSYHGAAEFMLGLIDYKIRR